MFGAIKPIAGPSRGFSDSEYLNRLLHIQNKMKQKDIDVLLLNTEAEVRYFSGFHTQFWQSPTRPWYLLVPQSGKPIAVIPSIGAECMGNSFVDDIRIWASPHPHDDGVSLLADTIIGIGGLKVSIGAMLGRETLYRAPLNDLDNLKSKLPSASWRDATTIIHNARSIKSPAEVEKIHHAARVASAAFGLVPEIIKTGMNEIEAFRAFKLACIAFGADDPAYLVGGAGNNGYGDIISPPSDRVIADGDVLILDTGCIWDGYFCDFDRNFAFGNADSNVKTAYKICWEATQAGLETAKPGVSCADLFHAMNNIMEPHNISTSGQVGRLGHGLGMQLTEFPSITSWDNTVLEEGMVLTLEPGYSFKDGKMMVHEENIAITSAGAELLTVRAEPDIPLL